MTARIAAFTWAVLCLVVIVPPVRAQVSDITTLQADVEALKKQVEMLQRELQDLKSRRRDRAAERPAEAGPITGRVGDGVVKGSADARLTLVEFTDYQCPFCARHNRETVPRLVETYVKTGKLKYVIRDYPIESIHPAAVKAAEAPHCASEGGRYWHMHDLLFAHPRAMAPKDLVAHAQTISLDAEAFSRCLESGKYAERVRQARADGDRAGVRGTPMFFLGVTETNNETITAVTTLRGAQPFERFEEAIEKLLAVPR